MRMLKKLAEKIYILFFKKCHKLVIDIYIKYKYNNKRKLKEKKYAS